MWMWRVLALTGWLTVAVHGLGVMSIDFGSEWFKVAIVKPGVPMEIALNKVCSTGAGAQLRFRATAFEAESY